MTHRCEAKGCTKTTRPFQLMCFYHWRMVPKKIKSEVWEAWEMFGPFTVNHDAAKQAAIDAVAAKEEK